jgi:hypothetical protein
VVGNVGEQASDHLDPLAGRPHGKHAHRQSRPVAITADLELLGGLSGAERPLDRVGHPAGHVRERVHERRADLGGLEAREPFGGVVHAHDPKIAVAEDDAVRGGFEGSRKQHVGRVVAAGHAGRHRMLRHFPSSVPIAHVPRHSARHDCA